MSTPDTRPCFFCGDEIQVPAWMDQQAPNCVKCGRRDPADVGHMQKREAYRREMLWQATCPALYRGTDESHKDIDADILARVTAWVPNKEAKGLGLIGRPGRCKTRMMFLLVKALITQHGLHVFAISATTFSRSVSDEYSSDEATQKEARKAVKKARTDAIVFVDDIGKQKMTERAEVELYDLLEERSAHMRPLLWTGNGNSESIASMMSKERAMSILRRLKEFSEIITV